MAEKRRGKTSMKQAEPIPEFTTISEASRFTNVNPKTIKKRINNLKVQHTFGTNNFYTTLDLIKCIYLKATDEEKSELNLTQERARYFKNLADKIAIENGKLSDRLLDADQVLVEISKNRIAVKEKLLNLTYSLANKIPRINDKQKAFNLLQSKFKEVLESLSGEESDNNNESTGKDKKQNLN